MFWDDLKKLISGPVLYRLDEMIGARLVPMLYVVGLAAALLWAVDHLVSSFALSFAQGLWSVIEIAVYGGLWLVVLRIVAETLLIFFASRTNLMAELDRRRRPASLFDEVGDAIHELAEDDEAEDSITPATDPVPFLLQTHDESDPTTEATPPRRGARRRPGVE